MVYDFVVRHLSPNAFGHKHKMEIEKKLCSVAHGCSELLICILQLMPCWNAPQERAFIHGDYILMSYKGLISFLHFNLHIGHDLHKL